MLVSAAINEIQNKINDRDKVGLDDSELLSYLNEAIQFISAYLVTYKSPQMVKTVTFSNSTGTLPSNFNQLCGYYPIKITGQVVNLLDEPPITIRYFASCDNVATTDDMPFNNLALNQLAIKIACIYAQNQEHEDISQDKLLVQELQQAIAASMGAGA